MQTWSENFKTSYNIIFWIHKHPKKVSNDFEQLTLYIPHRDEHLSLSDNDICETCILLVGMCIITF
jgi:hypothetical protein